MKQGVSYATGTRLFKPRQIGIVIHSWSERRARNTQHSTFNIQLLEKRFTASI
jgi:hypothetical protein